MPDPNEANGGQMPRVLALILLAACGKTAAPDGSPPVFGVTMVEETQCIGQGGRIVMEGSLGRCDMP